MALAATAILAASCAKDIMTKEEFDEGLFVKTTISADATLPGTDSIANDDKAYVDGSTRKVIWQSGDQLRINGTDLTVAEIDSGGVRAKFYGTVGAIPDGGNFRYWAVYPKTLATASTMNGPSTLTITLPETRQIDPSKNPLEGYSYMAGHAVVPPTASRIHFQMRNLGAVLKLTLTAASTDFGKRVDSIVFTSTNANLSGAFNINNASVPTITQGSGKKKHKVTFTGGGLDISSAKTIYVFLPPLTGKNLTMRIYGGYGFSTYVEKTVSNCTTLNRNEICTYNNNSLTFDKVFTVAKSSSGTLTKVIFSPGNLQWSRSNGTATNTTHTTAASSDEKYNYGTWRFAENQWNFVGSPSWDGTITPKGNVYGYNGTNTQCDNVNIAEGYKGWIDLFGWGTSGWKSSFPWLRNKDNTKYGPASGNIAGNNYDWGKYNAIYNPKTGKIDPAGSWRTMTKDEWNYLLFSRSGSRYAKATVNNVRGLIILPDGWNTSTYSLSNINSKTAAFSGNSISATQWRTLEQNGCVFLPACGYRWINTAYYNDVRRVVPTTTVYYWTSTVIDTKRAYHLRCDQDDGGHLEFSTGSTDDGKGRSEGFAVRLVRNH